MLLDVGLQISPGLALSGTDQTTVLLVGMFQSDMFTQQTEGENFVTKLAGYFIP